MSRNRLLLVAVLVAGLPASAAAQSNQVNASATVSSFAVLTGTGDLAFGIVSAVTDNTIDAAGGAGAALRTLDYNHDVRVTFSGVPTHLAANGGALQLPITLSCAARIGAAAWSVAVPCGTAQIDLDVGGTTTQATLGFGGAITAANVANAVAATYSGTFNIVITAR